MTAPKPDKEIQILRIASRILTRHGHTMAANECAKTIVEITQQKGGAV